MLFVQAHERERKAAAESLERVTLAVNNGLAISRYKEARRQFESARARRDAAEAPGPTVAEWRATKARLAARFPGNVKLVN